MPLEIRGALFNLECSISAGNTLRIGPGRCPANLAISVYASWVSAAPWRVTLNAMPDGRKT